MKKFFAIAMTAAAMISAASVSASACSGHAESKYDPDAKADVRVTVRLTQEQITGDAVFDQTVRVSDTDQDGRLTFADAMTCAFSLYKPGSTEPACENGCLFGQYGRYRVDITDGNGKQILGGTEYYNSDYELTDGLWVHAEPHIAEVDVYALEWSGSSPLGNYAKEYAANDRADLRTVKYPAGSFKPVAVSFTEIVIDGQPTGILTDANGKATIRLSQNPGSHMMTAKFAAGETDTVIGSYIYWMENPEWKANEAAQKGGKRISAVEEATAPAATTAAAQTTVTEAVTTAAVTTAQSTSAPVVTTAAVTAAPAVTTAAPAAATTASSAAVSTTASAKQTSATGTTKAGSLQTGDSMPVAALLFAGLAAAGTALAVSRRRKDQ